MKRNRERETERERERERERETQIKIHKDRKSPRKRGERELNTPKKIEFFSVNLIGGGIFFFVAPLH